MIKLKDIGIPVLFSGGVLVIWELLVLIFNVPEYLVPKPTRIISEIVTNFNSLLGHTGITMLEAFVGFIIANILGFIIGVIFAHSKTAEKGFYPYVIALKTTPIIAMAPLLVLWFGTSLISKIVAAAVICFFPILVSTVKGLRIVDEDSLKLFKSYYADKWQIFTRLRLPNSLPYIFSALKISTGLAVVGAVVGEFVGANRGIGYVILVSSYHLETVRMFAAIIMSALGGLVFFWLISLIEKKIIFWNEKEEF
ncbi:ABC transporter permease [Candidatus Woesearchaeota archaeon]|nr:ABC transporter permease [Candidatus Woesearchaeota archaeon]